MSNKELECLVKLVLIENSNDSEWRDPYFAQPKPKTNQVSFLSDFIYLNK